MTKKEVTQYLSEGVLLCSYPISFFLRIGVPLYRLNMKATKHTPIIIFEQWILQNSWHYFLKIRLEQEGYRVYMANFSFLKGGCDDGATFLHQFIQEKNIHHAILVGISLGAVSCLYYLQYLEGWKYVRNFISVGGSFYGSPLAYGFQFLKAGRQMLPKSPFTKQLTKNIQYASRIYCLSARKDELVPQWSSSLPKANNITIPVIGHNNLHIVSHKVSEIISLCADMHTTDLQGIETAVSKDSLF